MDYRSHRQAQAELTRRRLLDAANTLARQVGFDKMTVRDICQTAQVTTGAFYYHFTSKEDLLNRGFDSLDAYMEQALIPWQNASPLERLKALLRLYAGYMEQLGWETVARYYGRRLADPQAASMSPNRYTLRAMLECLTDLSRQGTLAPEYSPEWTAEFFFRHFRGVVVDWALHRAGYSLWDKLSQDYELFTVAFRV